MTFHNAYTLYFSIQNKKTGVWEEVQAQCSSVDAARTLFDALSNENEVHQDIELRQARP